LGIQAAEKTTAVAFMANAGPDGMNPNQQGISIAVDPNLGDSQSMSAGLAFFPEFMARPGKENDFSGSPRFLEGDGIHETQHQHFARALVLDYGGYQPARFFKRDVHDGSLHPA